MGLDMYLNKKTYVQNWNHTKPEHRYSITVLRGGLPVESIKPESIIYIEEQVAYWRKANAIHAWFVRECQDGVDECQTTYVSREKLEELLQDVTTVLASAQTIEGSIHTGTTWDAKGKHEDYEDGKVIADPTIAHNLLPTQPGFFFGGTDYDQYYIQDLTYTKATLEGILGEDDEIGEYYYNASW